MTAQGAIEKAARSISRRDAEILLLHVVGRDRAWLRAHPEAVLETEETADFLGLVSRREMRWPLQYLTGRQEFFGLELELSPSVLIPRPETELLVEAVLHWTADLEQAGEGFAWRIVDVGTGSGAIALALASRLLGAKIFAADVSPQVRQVVEGNASRLRLLDRVQFVESDLLAAFEAEIGAGRRFDVVVSNPPYVPLGDAPDMQAEVRDFEPHLALFAGEDGLAVYRRLIPQAWEALRVGGLLAMEFGFGQREALAGLLEGWRGVRFQDDYAGIPRLVLAERP